MAKTVQERVIDALEAGLEKRLGIESQAQRLAAAELTINGATNMQLLELISEAVEARINDLEQSLLIKLGISN